VDIALLRANARKIGICDIKQKATDILFTMTNLNFEAVGAICNDTDYKNRVLFVATAKEPTLRLKLVSGIDSLRQAKAFIDRFSKCIDSL
jgi:hypothetical protein